MDVEDAENYSVCIWRHPEDNRILKAEWRDENGALHKPYGPAIEEWAPNGERIAEEYYVHGKMHRDDGPASIRWDAITRAPYREIWAQHGHFHRDGMSPAWIERNLRSGVTTTAKYYVDGKLHRKDGPAVIERDAKSGIAIREIWMYEDEAHCAVNFPADITRDAETGIIVEEHYAQHGLWHREDGPAIIKRDAQTGKITSQSYWEHGKSCDIDLQPPTPET